MGLEAEQRRMTLDDDDDIEEPVLNICIAAITVVVSTTFIAFNTQLTTDSIQTVLDVAGFLPVFIGAALLPILSCDFSSVTVAINDKLDLSIALTPGRRMQTSLMVVPLIVLLAWAMGIPLTLEYDHFRVVALFASIIFVTHVVQ